MNQRPVKIQALLQLFVFICVTVFCGKVEAGKKQSSSTIVIQNNGGGEEEEVTHNVIPIPYPIPYRVIKHQSHLIPLHQPPPMGMTRSPPMMFSGTSHQPYQQPLGITTNIPMALPPNPPLPPHQKFHNFLALRMEPIGAHQFPNGFSSIPPPPSPINPMDPKMVNFYSLYKPWPPAITVPRTTVQYDRPPTIQPNDDYKQGDELESERNPPDEYPQEYYPDEYVNDNNNPKAGDIRTHPPQEYPENDYNKGNDIDDYHREYEKDYPPVDPNVGENNDNDYRVNDIEHNPPQAPVPPSPPIPDIPPDIPPQSPPPSNSVEDERDSEYSNGEYTNEYYDEPKNSPEYYTTHQSNRPSSIPPPSSYSSTIPGNIPEAIEYSYGPEGIDPGIEYLEDFGLDQNKKSKLKKSQPKKRPEYSGKFSKNYDYYTEKPFIKSVSNRIPSEEIIDYGLNFNRGIPQAEFEDPMYNLKDNYEYLGYPDANRRSAGDNRYYRDDEDEYQQVENRFWSSNRDSEQSPVFGQRRAKYRS
ncbi:uncharacterized protein LOC141858636 [Brevipalpus obovatus]|uniref:uncharacterized protein LOC141858636 n=1 Tax=Brevipalpus obovatus TaxID=246614 RepID=UPI003D9ECF0F